MKSLLLFCWKKCTKPFEILKIRLQHHLLQSQDIIRKAEETQMEGKGAALTYEEQEALAKVQNIQDQLQNSIIQIDESIMTLTF